MSKYPITIFLPAAGLGERLRPITNHIPKPLLPILGRPLIEITLHKLTKVCSGKIGINLHYKSEMIREWIQKSPYAGQTVFFPENPILGTGGALKNAEAFLLGSHFLVHNSDILIDIDFKRLINEHVASRNMATLVCHRIPELSNVIIDQDNQVLDVENPGESRPNVSNSARKIAYTGIALYSPEILKFLPSGVSHATVAWVAASKAGHKIRAKDFTGCRWNDIGTPITYTRAVLDALRHEGETVSISPSAHLGSINIDGNIVVESGSAVADGSHIRNCILMPNASVTGFHENKILGPDYEISLSESDMQPSLHATAKKQVSLKEPLFMKDFDSQSSCRADAILIGLGGSDRRYYRIRHNEKTAVLMECTPEDPDYERHIEYTCFFSSHTMPVPRLLATDKKNKRALFEDLGDTSLYAFLKLPHKNTSIEEIYHRVLDILVKLHTSATKHVHECPLLADRIFDYDYFRWETTYFLERFIKEIKHLAIDNITHLEQELHTLAEKAAAFPKGIIHRDFQCQNIMITANNIPRVIDFQGARMAPPAYDVASILWDPYYHVEDSLRERLVQYYCKRMTAQSDTFNERIFQESLSVCRLQRHMQALGAYGFLSAVKGKEYFLKYVPEAVKLFKEDISAVKNEYPGLHELANKL
ncbi:MAG: phosphotransferase [Nitrospirota bacterium]